MKKMISLIALFAISTSAFAFDYKISLEGRADFIHSNTDTTSAAGVETEAKFNGFQSGLIRLMLAGSITETLSYKFRYRFNQVPVATARDSSTNSLDYLYVDHKNALFTTRFGKHNWAESYGRESFISSTDLFLATAAYSAYNSNIGNYRFGVSATKTVADTHKLTFAISNPNTAVTDTTGQQKNTSLAYGAHYSSVLFGKLFQPLLSYTLAKQDGDAQTFRPNADFTMMAAGWRTEVGNLIVDADWKQFKRERIVSTGADDKTSSIFVNAAFNMERLSPFIQYANDKFRDDIPSDAAEYDRNIYVAGLMFKPYTDVTFRYHLAYSLSKQEFDAPTATNREVEDNRIIFGIKADI